MYICVVRLLTHTHIYIPTYLNISLSLSLSFLSETAVLCWGSAKRSREKRPNAKDQKRHKRSA